MENDEKQQNAGNGSPQGKMTEGPQSETQESFEAFAEWLSAGAAAFGALAGGGKIGYDMYKGSRAAPKPDEPLLVSVAATRSTESAHELLIHVHNLGIHGVYLGDLSVVKPKRISVQELEEYTPSDPGIGFGGGGLEEYYPSSPGIGSPESTSAKYRRGSPSPDEPDNDAPFIPAFVAGGQAVSFSVRIDPFKPKRLKDKPYGELKLNYTVAGVAKSGLTETIEFSVRPLKTPDS